MKKLFVFIKFENPVLKHKKGVNKDSLSSG